MAIITQSNVHLILGGARSGKSGYGESMAKQTDLDVIYVATAQAHDQEMSERIAQHQLDRPKHWLTIEEPLALADVIQAHSKSNSVVLVDCLTLWLMNVMHHELDLAEQVDALLATLEQAPGLVILVSNEISMGVVPMGELSRRYVDNLGRLHQQIAKHAQQVTLMVAGIPMAVKSRV
ncbi:bifunctional adenosylcobinamide kinase/adenosylcobinamide-phosphate guanylyltransferase [Bermanella sp. WJH001]|uniref:bifunctional adenosylcobinamide kinase/adenosylcobinamide-phosphate guanylyltransferase n=1 Tax=Bermanella sp. WJH001 TaxID=3048005 RepID=UPI0024BE3A70|nr:bifunctional adenosylcobinamide kinase/adenosylcobinamide-phosphate guanylyltransferase [Bermanella sp. WJH001]MDJ1539655.1 bifunctional adenosylcobinamide kinase/adenosylcobinamide-phosphate guanylyltransferase [Bermanella sp. WJH001]